MIDGSPRPRAFRLHPLRVTLAALALLAPAVPSVADPAGKGRAPDLSDCPDLQVPEGNKVGFHTYAEGVQIYRWDGTSWSFVAPEAVLSTDAGGHGVVGIHYVGPTWEGVDGSQVVG